LSVVSLRVKKYVVYGALLLLTLWPLVHVWLVERYDVSPWKLGGWGMYAAPRPSFWGMEVYYRLAGSHDFVQLTTPTVPERAEAGAFLQSHRWLRKLVPPDRFAGVVMDSDPRIDAVKIVVVHPVMNAKTGMIEASRNVYEYP
jgi:hypothetical protein